MESRLIWDQEAAGSNPACSTSGIAAKLRVPGETKRRGWPCERYFILLSGVLQHSAATDLAAGRIRARSGIHENPSRQPDTVVHSRVPVGVPRRAHRKSARKSGSFPERIWKVKPV